MGWPQYVQAFFFRWWFRSCMANHGCMALMYFRFFDLMEKQLIIGTVEEQIAFSLEEWRECKKGGE